METPGQSERIISEHVQLNRKKFVRMAASWLRDPGSAEDAVQEALVDALKPSAKFDVSRKVGPWFNKVLLNRCLMIKRARSRHPEQRESDQPLSADNEEYERFVEAMVVGADDVFTAVTTDVFSFAGPGGVYVDVSFKQLMAGIPAMEVEIFEAVTIGRASRAEVRAKYGIKAPDVSAVMDRVRRQSAQNLADALSKVATKTCRGCGQKKPVDDFYRKPTCSDGRDALCKHCRVRKVMIGRNAERKRENDRAYKRRRVRRRTIFSSVVKPTLGNFSHGNRALDKANH